MKGLLNSTCWSALPCSGALAATPPRAQQPAAAQQTETAPDNASTTIDDIVVTAQRRFENIQKVPINPKPPDGLASTAGGRYTSEHPASAA